MKSLVKRVLTLSLTAMFFNQITFALEDDLQKAILISITANRFQAERIKIAAENIANQDVTSTIPGGNPYTRKIIFAKNIYDKTKDTYLLKVSKIDFDKNDFIIKYSPNHPAADQNGNVKYPNINYLIEKADADEGKQSYEANLSIIETTNNMIQKTIEAIK